ncbi:MAG: DUF1634 domain-containing protein [Terriglobia bacterium]
MQTGSQVHEYEDRAQDAIALVLRYGSAVSTAVMALGLIYGLLRSGGRLARPVPPASPATLLSRALRFDPMGVLELGILFLLLTPVFRIVIAALAFGLERDTKYLLISLGVLGVVVFSIAYALY